MTSLHAMNALKPKPLALIVRIFATGRVFCLCGVTAMVVTAFAPSSTADQRKTKPRIAVLRGSLSSYRDASNVLRDELSARSCDVELFVLPKRADAVQASQLVERVLQFQPDVIATAGLKASETVVSASPGIPVVYFLVPNVLDASFINSAGSNGTRVVGVSSDLSPAARISWVQRVDADATHIAVLHSLATQRTVQSIKEAAASRGIRITAIKADRQAFPKAILAIESAACDGVMMIPDAKVFNSPNIRNLLVWGARNRVPVWGFSRNIVKAGALAGQSFDSNDVGRQTAKLVLEILDGKNVFSAPIQYAGRADTAVNLHIARIIGIRLDPSRVGANTVRFGDK